MLNEWGMINMSHNHNR